MGTRRTADGVQESRSVAAARALRWSLWVLGAVVGVLLVTWLAVDAWTGDPAEPAPSRSEQAQLDAEERYRALAADAQVVGAGSAADDPVLAARLDDLAADLEAQADAVALPRLAEGPGSTGHAGTPPGAAAQRPPTRPTAVGPAAAAPLPPSPAEVLRLLDESALTSLVAAVDADPGPARVLASAGVNQWRHATLLADALGTVPSLAPGGVFPAGDLSAGSGVFTEVAARLAAEQAADGGATDPTAPPADGAAHECPDAPPGADADRRVLLAAQLAEEGAGYAYEVAAARLPGERNALLERSASHAAAAADAGHRLAALCLPPAPVPPGFALGAGFGADPLTALARLEQQHVDLYAGLVPSAGRDTRAWAIAGLTASVQRTAGAGVPADTFPGLRAPAADSPEGASEGGGTDG